MYIFTEEKWDTALLAFIALHAASIVLHSLFTSCHLIHFYFAAQPSVLTTWAVQTHISYLLTWVLWHYEPLVTPDALITPHTRHIPIGLWWPRPPNWWWPLSLPLVWLSLRNRRLGSGCAASGHLSLDNEASTTQMRSHLEWIDQDRRLSLIIAALTHRRVVTISQDLMSYPLEFPWFLEIKFLLLIDERNFNQSSIWHFRSSNFSVAKTTQIPVCQ